MKLYFLLPLVLLGVFGKLQTQENIPFLQDSYEEALDIADQAYKPLMFYFHSDNCINCMELDSLFRQEALVQFFAINYINVKVDLSRPMGVRLKNILKIRSLPTLVFLNEKQEIVFSVEEGFTLKNILRYGNWTIDPGMASDSYQEALKIKEKIDNREKVDSIFDFIVLDNRVIERQSETTLYYQSFLHKILEDGQAAELASKYLKTQTDWEQPKNLDFIFDFISDTRSPEFSFLVENQKLFEERFGAKRVDSLLHVLVRKHLYQLQPLPNYQQAKELLKILNPENSDVKTYEYLIELSLKMKSYAEYLTLERKYISKFAPRDHERMIRLVDVYLENVPGNYNAEYYMQIAKTANKLNPNNIDYLISWSRACFKAREKCDAMDNAVKAVALSMEEGRDIDPILQLLLEINTLH